MTSTVVILGCGYVGTELGRRLTASEYVENVVGVRRSSEGVSAIETAGFEAVQGDLTNPVTLGTLPDADVVVFTASSGGGDATAAQEVYVEGQQTVLEHFGDREHPLERYIYTSSTGVYGDHRGEWVDEETPLEATNDRSRVLVEAETVALETASDYDIDGTVARFGGLYGPGRYRLDRYLTGPVTEGVLNLTHRDDAAGALAFFIEEGCARGEVVLVVDDEPVSKWELADWLAQQCGEAVPPKQTKAQRLADESLSSAARHRIQAEKRCRNDRLRALGYNLQYPSFREGYRHAVEASTI